MKRHRLHRSNREIVVLAHDGFDLLAVTGALSVFSTATRLLGERGPQYAVKLVAHRSGLVRSSSGIQVRADQAIDEVSGLIDTFIVTGPGSPPLRKIRDDLAAEARRVGLASRRVASVCTGAFVLGAAGLLDSRRATTHWAVCGELQERAPRCTVETGQLVVRDGNIWTSAGLGAGVDLCLALVEADHGRDVAVEVARWLVTYLQRPEAQTQVSIPMSEQRGVTLPLRELQEWILNHLHLSLSVDQLACRAKMSPRTFARAFHAATGATPAAYVLAERLRFARAWLEGSDESITAVGARCGFGRAETFSRAFVRAFGTTPSRYRRENAEARTSSRSATE